MQSNYNVWAQGAKMNKYPLTAAQARTMASLLNRAGAQDARAIRFKTTYD